MTVFSRANVLIMNNNDAVSFFFEQNNLPVKYSKYKMNFNYSDHVLNWWQDSSKYTLSEEILKDLSKYRGILNRDFAENFLQKNYNAALGFFSPFYDDINTRSSFTKLTNAVVDVNGIIISEKNRIIPRSCLFCENTCVPHNNQKFLSSFQQNVTKSVTISQYWGNGYYHFVAENLPRLLPVISQHETPDLTVHVHQKNKFVIEFLKILSFEPEQIISGKIFAQILFVPEFIACGNTPGYLLHEMHTKFSLALMNAKYQNNNKCHVVFIKRKTRAILNHQEIVQKIACRFSNCIVSEHNGNEAVIDQLKLLQSSTAVIAPHGAGLVNIFVCRKNTLIIEFLNKKMDAHILYMVMSLKLGLRYIGIGVSGSGVKHTNKEIDISFLILVLRKYLFQF